MKNRILISITLIAILLSACAQTSATLGAGEATAVPVVVDDFAVIAEGRLVPRESVQLSFVTAGQVAEILVEEGGVVNAGDVLARLGDREQLY